MNKGYRLYIHLKDGNTTKKDFDWPPDAHKEAKETDNVFFYEIEDRDSGGVIFTNKPWISLSQERRIREQTGVPYNGR